MASVPDTNSFTLQDVVAVVGGASLTAAFANSTDGLFDPAYKGSKNSLLNFRNYNGAGVVFLSVNPTSWNFLNAGGVKSISVLASVGNLWAATTASPFLHISSGGGSGNGSFTITCDSGSNSSGTVTVTSAAPDATVSVTRHP